MAEEEGVLMVHVYDTGKCERHGCDLVEVRVRSGDLYIDGELVQKGKRWVRVCPECPGGAEYIKLIGRVLKGETP